MFNWFNYLSYILIIAVTPGPNNIMSMTHASRRGLRKSFPFNLGVWAGFILVMLLCTAFCSTLSTLIPKIQPVMLIIGAAYMLYLAWKTFRSSSVSEKEAGSATFLSGFVLQFLNPKVILAGIVSIQTYILPYYQGKIAPLCFFAVLYATTGFLCTLLWALFGSVLRTLFSRYAKVTNTIMALLLVYCAIALFI